MEIIKVSTSYLTVGFSDHGGDRVLVLSITREVPLIYVILFQSRMSTAVHQAHVNQFESDFLARWEQHHLGGSSDGQFLQQDGDRKMVPPIHFGFSHRVARNHVISPLPSMMTQRVPAVSFSAPPFQAHSVFSTLYVHQHMSIMNPVGPHRRHRTSLEGVIDLPSSAERPSSPRQHTRAKALFHHIINQCQGSSSPIADKGYSRPKLIHLVYEYARSEESQWLILREFFRTLNIPIDDAVDSYDAAAVAELQPSVIAFADYLMDNFFLPCK